MIKQGIAFLFEAGEVSRCCSVFQKKLEGTVDIQFVLFSFINVNKVTSPSLLNLTGMPEAPQPLLV